MRKKGFIKVCEKFYCDYVPCVEQRIAELDAEGFDTGKLRGWLVELRAEDGRMSDAEMAWLGALDEKVAIV